jgi:hypothetical protein
MLTILGYDDITVHGFRPAFRDWAGDRTIFRARLSNMPWRMSLKTTQNLPIGAVMPWNAAGVDGSLGSLLRHRRPHAGCSYGRAIVWTAAISVLSEMGDDFGQKVP